MNPNSQEQNSLIAAIERLDRNPNPEEIKTELLRTFPELNQRHELLDKLVSFVEKQIQLAYAPGYQKGYDAGFGDACYSRHIRGWPA